VVDLCDELLEENENDVTALFFKGGALGFTGRLKFHRDDWFGAANAGRQALPLVQDAVAADPQNYDLFLGTGIYNYYAAVIPEQYPVAKPLLLFIPSGDKRKGIEQLETAAAKGRYASVEAKYFLMQLYYLYEKEYGKAFAIAGELHRRYPDNMLFHRYVGRCLITMGRYREAGELFAEVDRLVDTGKPGYNTVVEREAEYYLGMSAMMQEEYSGALSHYYRADELSRLLDKEGPSGFMAMTNLNIGKVYDLLSRRDLAVAQYQKVLGMTEYRDTHDLAERYLRNPYSR
jgi:tetratricopeptide (TPR) repeat protein